MKDDLRRREQELRQAKKQILQMEFQRKSLQTNLRDAEEALHTAAKLVRKDNVLKSCRPQNMFYALSVFRLFFFLVVLCSYPLSYLYTQVHMHVHAHTNFFKLALAAFLHCYRTNGCVFPQGQRNSSSLP